MFNILVGQSGGPTAVINASLAGVVKEALNTKEIDYVYGMINGIEGFAKGKIFDFTKYAKENELDRLKATPASFLGSCRYKLPEDFDDEIFIDLFQKFEELEIKAVVYIGGNDSMDTVAKLSAYADKINSKMRFIGIPKTIDNDLVCTDHTPGFGSTAKYVASVVREIVLDAGVYTKPVVTIIELMGRHAGWVTAASILARTEYDKNPMLVYLPESEFNMETFIDDVRKALVRQNSVVVCISEGIVDSEGTFICEYGAEAGVDGFGHKMLAGSAKVLENAVSKSIGCKTRSIELNLSQRCSAIIASATDVEEAMQAGVYGVRSIMEGETGSMIAFEREDKDEYEIKMKTVNVAEVCNKEKSFPSCWITANGTDISEEFIHYVAPLLRGESDVVFKNGLPQYLKPAYKMDEYVVE